MDIKEILKRSDELFQEGRSLRAAEFLRDKTSQAREAGEWETELSIINELMGYCRNGKENTAEGMTACLNVANVYRASGKLKEALELYRRIEQVYGKLEMEEDYRLGGLYNNMAVAYLELGELDESVRYGEKADQILNKI